MPNRNNNVHFNIPIPIIVIAFIYCWPVGIVLTILRGLSTHEQNKGDLRSTDRSEVKKTFERADVRGRRKTRHTKGKNISTATKLSRLLAILLGCLSVFLTLMIGVELLPGISLGEFLPLFLAIAFPFCTASVGFGIASKAFGNRDTRFGRIRAIIGNRESINLTKLALASDESLKKVRKDVQEMIDKGEFGEYAYIDLGTNNFMRSPYAEPDEPENLDHRSVKSDDLSENISTETTTRAEESNDFGKIISEIRRLNDDIADVQVSERIDRIEEHTRNIFEYVTDHPDAMPQIRTFMNYYLPTTLKLLESYSRIERVGVAGENMKQSKEKIESILDLLVIGFEQQVDQLFKNESIDISSDITVLEKMIQKDGLSGKSDFDVSKYNEFSDEISDVLGGAAAQSAPTSDPEASEQ